MYFYHSLKTDPQTMCVHIYLTYIYYHKNLEKLDPMLSALLTSKGRESPVTDWYSYRRKRLCFVLSKTQNKRVVHVFLNVHKCINYILKFWKLVVVISL